MSLMTSLPAGYRALVVGASGTIGRSFIEQLTCDDRCAVVERLDRSSPAPLILEDEAAITSAVQSIATCGPFHLILDATGALTIDGQGPEKRLESMSANGLMRAFQINAIGRGLILRECIPLLPRKERSIFGVLSARVGSISDNHLGGWYGYRASKAAGNMLLQTAAIESHRSRPWAVFAALQPGTVVSRLSEQFSRGHETVTAGNSTIGMLNSLNALTARSQAWFVDYRGQTIDW
jgi:NAD(P)-dependent dehydrogenase (short-subunit alcohol dehydrogenase family)